MIYLHSSAFISG